MAHSNGADQDIKPGWKNAARRMQSVACAQRGFAIVQLAVLVGPDGSPVFWMEPEMTRIEPMQASGEFLTETLRSMIKP